MLQKDTAMFLLLWIFSLLFVRSYASPPNRIQHNRKDIFLSGINVAWGPVSFGNDISYLDPMCTSATCVEDQDYFASMMKDIQDHGGNSLRFWVHPDGHPLPVINDDYSTRLIAPISDSYLRSLHFVLAMAERYDLLVNLCLWSFDMVNDMGYGIEYGLWNKILTNDTNMQSYISNWLVPLVVELRSHRSLLSLEVFNEPEGMTDVWGWTTCTSDTSDCARVNVSTLQKVTVGSWSYIASSDLYDNVNIWCDAALIAAGGHSNGILDFYQVHYYNWAYPDYSPFLHNASYWLADDKPHVIGEFPNNPIPFEADLSAGYCYEELYNGGYAGAWGWCYNCLQDSEDFNRESYLQNMKYMWDMYGSKGWPE